MQNGFMSITFSELQVLESAALEFDLFVKCNHDFEEPNSDHFDNLRLFMEALKTGRGST